MSYFTKSLTLAAATAMLAVGVGHAKQNIEVDLAPTALRPEASGKVAVSVRQPSDAKVTIRL